MDYKTIEEIIEQRKKEWRDKPTEGERVLIFQELNEVQEKIESQIEERLEGLNEKDYSDNEYLQQRKKGVMNVLASLIDKNKDMTDFTGDAQSR